MPKKKLATTKSKYPGKTLVQAWIDIRAANRFKSAASLRGTPVAEALEEAVTDYADKRNIPREG